MPRGWVLLDFWEIHSFPRITRIDADDGGIIRDHPCNPRQRLNSGRHSMRPLMPAE